MGEVCGYLYSSEVISIMAKGLVAEDIEGSAKRIFRVSD